MLRLSAEETDDVGRWFGYYINDTWIGSLRLPPGSKIWPHCATPIEVYGGRPVKPSNIPYWKVSVEAPVADGRKAKLVATEYPQFPHVGESLQNVLITKEGDGVTFEVGMNHIPDRDVPSPTPTPIAVADLSNLELIERATTLLLEAGSARYKLWGGYTNNCSQHFATRQNPDTLEISGWGFHSWYADTIRYVSSSSGVVHYAKWNGNEWERWRIDKTGARDAEMVANSLGQPVQSDHFLHKMLLVIDQYIEEKDIVVPTRTEDSVELRVLFTDPQRVGFHENYRRIDFSVTLNLGTLEIDKFKFRVQWQGHRSCDYEEIGSLDAYGIEIEKPEEIED